MDISRGMDDQEFLRLYDELGDALFRHGFYRVYDRERANDLVQETFLHAWEYMTRGQPIRNMRAFLYRIINNLIIDESRKKKSLSLDALAEAGYEPARDDRPQFDINLDAGQVIATLKKLDPDYREVFQMRFIDGLPPRDIAAILGESPNVISVRIHRATKQLRAILSYDQS